MAAQHVNRHLLEALPLFASAKHADCFIIFYLDADKTDAENTRGKRLRLANGSALPLPPKVVFGDPLPAHRWVLEAASVFFQAQERWANNGPSGRPELRIPLGSEDEAAGARAAIEFAYTGRVKSVSGVRAVLETRWQAQVLEIRDCAQVCDEALQRILDDDGAAAGAAAGPSSGAGGVASTQQQQPPVLQLYACEELWPNPAAEPSFAAVLQQAASKLVAHFGDALRTICTSSLRAQLLGLPPTGLRALLGSNGFGSDDEASVLALLATWIKRNYDDTDEQVRQQLCRTVRLAQVATPYRDVVVPVLATDYEINPQRPAGWFPLGSTDASYVTGFAKLTDPERRRLLACQRNDPWVIGSGRLLDLTPRPQCIPPEGLTFSWSLDQQDLLSHLQALKPGREPKVVQLTFDQVGGPYILSRGFEWGLGIQLTAAAPGHRPPAAGLSLVCHLPAAFRVSGSRLRAAKRFSACVPVDARVTVRRWQQRRDGGGDAAAAAADVTVSWGGATDTVVVGFGCALSDVLPLLQQPGEGGGGDGATAATSSSGAAASGGGGSANAAAGGSVETDAGSGGGGGSTTVGGGDGGDDPLAAWGEYLRDGKIRGNLTIMRPPQRSAPAEAKQATARVVGNG
ncbi:hypothetical protein PLESTB_000823000 [Pleodorina starrii]|uniref:BACK domain-containing protein n=1 Tax=Pleodorina starrii TaxID=330485 RepID=A0A9W6BL99_9CHLO|nr:hypothetical protein PLESTM_000138500 [Pleodorina starrii]GLC54093.1 hypothetical protein PLESTB_000823000 [Pleodorina starrii]GLC64602.1 hypothetical protein PLESTF_000183400 [Pleodorina starrii]